MRVSPLINVPVGRYTVMSLLLKAADMKLYENSTLVAGRVCSQQNLRAMIRRARPTPTSTAWEIPFYKWTITKTKQGFIIHVWN